MADERYKFITVRQMLAHRSGMPDVEDYEWARPQYDDAALERYVRSLGNLELLFAPGERFAYSNIAFEVLGDLIAKVSGETFDDYIQRHILVPLAMKDSTLMIRRANSRLLAWGHELDKRGEPAPSAVYPYNRMHSPSSNLHSNVADMARWAMANTNRGELDGVRILPASAYDVMWTRVAEVPGRPSAPGMSWFLSDYRGNQMVSHSGDDTGFNTGLAMLPDKEIAMVWMTNADWLTEGRTITRAALDVALGLKPQP
jgi:CubicO group peptidase (beta-lactamase class C family)